jgi:hypothetical protein
MFTYDPRGHTWDSWCALMAELFASNQLGTLPEEQWRLWADGMQGIGYFVQSGIPDHRGFPTWDEWAKSLCGIMSIQPSQI